MSPIPDPVDQIHQENPPSGGPSSPPPTPSRWPVWFALLLIAALAAVALVAQ